MRVVFVVLVSILMVAMMAGAVVAAFDASQHSVSIFHVIALVGGAGVVVMSYDIIDRELKR